MLLLSEMQNRHAPCSRYAVCMSLAHLYLQHCVSAEILKQSTLERRMLFRPFVVAVKTARLLHFPSGIPVSSCWSLSCKWNVILWLENIELPAHSSHYYHHCHQNEVIFTDISQSHTITIGLQTTDIYGVSCSLHFHRNRYISSPWNALLTEVLSYI